MPHHEKELKFALGTVQDYERLRRLLPNLQKTTQQRNFYLDTPSRRLAGQRIMLRVREEAGAVSVCVKQNATVTAGYFTAEEITIPLDHTLWEQVKAGALAFSDLPSLPECPELTKLLPSESLHILGSIETERCYFWHEGGFYIELDRIRMANGEEEYEVEVETETPETACSFLVTLFTSQHISWTEQTLTKYERFLRRHR